MGKVERFSAFDLVRGVASIAVVILHYAGSLELNWIPRAWMAVDLFFILSGFVLMHSYGAKIASGRLGFRDFMTIRLLRLLPLYLVGLLLGYVQVRYSCALPEGRCTPEILPALAFGSLTLPYFSEAIWPFGLGKMATPFPLNMPAWSLFFEFFVNLFFFYWLAWQRRGLLFFTLATALCLYGIAYYLNTSVNGGWNNSNFYVGFPRVLYHFFVGVCIYTLYPKYGPNSRTLAFLLLGMLLLTYSMDKSSVSMVALFVLAPAVVLSSAKLEMTGWGKTCCSCLGDFSYPLYIVHWPLFQLMFLFLPLGGLSPAEKVLAMTAIAVLSAAGLALGDKKARRMYAVYVKGLRHAT